MARPSKPAAVIRSEGKSHRTKAQLEKRENGEAALLSGKRCFERASVKADKIAHAEFARLIKLMRAIGKDDALYAPEYNRYCELFSEAEAYRADILLLRAEMSELRSLSASVTGLAEQLSGTAGNVQKQGTSPGVKKAAQRLSEGAECGGNIDVEQLNNLLAAVNDLNETRGKLFGQISALDTKLKQKREAMFAIEKENCMTVSAALRTIPKEAEKKEDDPLMKLLMSDEL